MSSLSPNRVCPSSGAVPVAQSPGISRLGLAPFRSLSALSRPKRTAERIVRVLVNGAGCKFARCELPELDVAIEKVTIEKKTARPEDGVRRIVVIPSETGSVGRIEIGASKAHVETLEANLQFMAHTLGTFVALHRSPGIRHGVVISAGNVHLLANIVNSLRMQLLVTVAYRGKGRSEKVGPFLERALAQCERLDNYIVGLRRR